MSAARDEQRRSRSRTVLAVLAAVLAVLAMVKYFAADVYRVKSGSMRPTLFGGEEARAKDHLELSEWVLVNYVREPEVARFDLVVLEGEHAPDPLVKRVAGLGGERVTLVGGDLLVNGERLGPAEPRPAPVLLFDDAILSVRDAFRFAEPRWRELDGAWRVDASVAGESTHAETLMQYEPDLTDGYLRNDGTFVPGTQQVNDGVLAVEARVEARRGTLVLELVEEGDLFRAEVVLDGEVPTLRVLRRNDEILRETQAPDSTDRTPWRVLRSEPVDFAPGVWHQLRFANVDNHLLVRLDGLEYVATYERNAPFTSLELRGTRKSLGTRVRFGADGGVVDFRRVRVYRDLYWTASGDFATGSSYDLGPGEVFLLGDNSTYSTDSRSFGAVPLREILGRPIAVVWPPERARKLESTVR